MAWHRQTLGWQMPRPGRPATGGGTGTRGRAKIGDRLVHHRQRGACFAAGLINQSFEVMQTSLAQYKIAGYPPDVLINVPKRVCRFFEFYKAPELIAWDGKLRGIRWITMKG